MSTSLLIIRAVLWIVSIALLAVAAGTDLRRRIIPNRIVLMLAVGGLTLSLLSTPQLAWINLIVAVLLLAGLGALAHRRYLGGGDAKLIAAVSLLVPPQHIGSLLMAIAFAGGLLSLIYLAAYHMLTPVRLARRKSGPRPRSRIRRTWLVDERVRLTAGNSVPYGVAVLGGVTAYFASELYQCLYATSCSL
jgi:prepilin peptidase CpaA